jgi:hypothetical protein
MYPVTTGHVEHSQACRALSPRHPACCPRRSVLADRICHVSDPSPAGYPISPPIKCFPTNAVSSCLHDPQATPQSKNAGLYFPDSLLRWLPCRPRSQLQRDLIRYVLHRITHRFPGGWVGSQARETRCFVLAKSDVVYTPLNIGAWLIT